MKLVFLVALLVLWMVETTKFKIHVDKKAGPACFFHRMGLNQKYSFQVTSLSGQMFRMDVFIQVDNSWEQVMTKTSNKISEYIQKFANRQGVYMFCLIAIHDPILVARMQIMSGLQMMNFQTLPDLTDNENLNRQVQWLARQKEKLFQTIQRIDFAKESSETLDDMMSRSYIFMAVLGLAAIVGVNFMFYKQTKKTLKDRKLI